MHQPFNELALLLAAAIGVVAVRLRQPLILVYIIIQDIAEPLPI